MRCVSESDISTYTGCEDSEEGEDETCEWDITWCWDDDFSLAAPADPAESDSLGGHDSDCESACEWDITWVWAEDPAWPRSPRPGGAPRTGGPRCDETYESSSKDSGDQPSGLCDRNT